MNRSHKVFMLGWLILCAEFGGGLASADLTQPVPTPMMILLGVTVGTTFLATIAVAIFDARGIGRD